MTTITVTPELLKQLNGLIGPLEFRDPEGRLLGAFQPTGEKPTYAQVIATSPHTEEELLEEARQCLASGGGRTLLDILKDLQSKWPSE